METQAKVLSQNMNINKSGFLFAPKVAVLLALIADGIKSGDDELRWFSTAKSAIFNAIDYIVQNFHTTNSGRVTIGMLYDALEKVAKIYEMMQFFSHLRPKNFMKEEQLGSVDSEGTLIAIGVLNEDYKDGDSDPYQTAGGYRAWIAKKGTEVRYYLNNDLSIRLEFDSNCIVDHYNNNFAGVSTGGGTTRYELGERVEKRSVNLGREAFDKTWKKAPIDATANTIDLFRLKELATKLVPEFAFVLG